jgi:Fe-S oxidoreductase
MGPSYMATLDEKHSTRGRANALRLAMAGRLGEAGLGDEGVREVLDLCLECRACKAECPVGVDVARFKSEFLADYWSRHGTPLRARFLGGIHDVSRWASRLAPVSTWMAQCAPGRWMAEALLGIDSRRIPPAWTRRTFRQRFEAGPDLTHPSLRRHLHQLLQSAGRNGGSQLFGQRASRLEWRRTDAAGARSSHRLSSRLVPRRKPTPTGAPVG